jgi:hypothetical protein
MKTCLSSALLLAALLLAMPSWGAVSSEDVLLKAQAANEDLYSALQSFVCLEQIDRYQGRLDGRTAHVIDTVSANLSFENGVEHYSEIRQNGQGRGSISGLAGAWSEGEFGTLLRQTEKLLALQPVSFEAFTDLDGTPAAIYSFDVSEQDSPWDFIVSGHHYRLPFRTDVWISTSKAEILKIARASLSVPPQTRISEVDWAVTLEPVALNDKQWLLPKSGQYTVLYQQSNRREWNVMNFSNYRRYGAEVALRFDGAQ